MPKEMWAAVGAGGSAAMFLAKIMLDVKNIFLTSMSFGQTLSDYD